MKNLIAFALIAALLLAPFASATVSEVTAEASSSSVTMGTSVTVTSAVTATESETTSIQLVSSPSGITISDPASGSYSSVAVSTTPVTKTFTITAGSAGTYTYYAQAGSTQSTAKTIVFSDPSILTITGDSSAVTKSAGDTLTLSITLTNSQASAITSYYSLNLPSGYYTVTSGDPQTSAGRSFAVGTTTLSWTISIASGASTGTIAFQLGSNTNAFSKSVTIPSSSITATTTTTTSSGSSSTTVFNAATGRLTKTFTSIAPYAPRTIYESDLKDTNTGLTQIDISVKNLAVNVKITVEKLAGKPASITQEAVSANGMVYKFMNITKENLADADIEKAKINFKIEKSWLSANNFTASQIALKRFVSQWEKLNTTLISQDGNYSYYAADSPGFSIFAVAADKDIVTPAQSEQPAQPETPEQPAQEQQPQLEQQPAASNAAGYIVAIAVILIIAAVALYFADKKGLIKVPRKILGK